MVKVKQTEDELKSHLKEQIEFLRNSAKLYDEGYVSEAKRISLTIRILLHDYEKSNSHSLLKQLNKKDILFYDTSNDEKVGHLFFHGLIITSIKFESGYITVKNVPRFEAPPPDPIRKIPFKDWWNKIVLDDKNGNKLTREELVRYVADQDGGAHVDSNLNETYARITRDHSIVKWMVKSNGDSFVDNNVVLPSIRQIAYEILLSFENGGLIEKCPDYPK